ncbi:MAG: phosphoribulokinase [Chloroflexota bacterium]|nr:MAG: phosphoribulokinase [Chloroflexota bacterium]
MPYKKSILLGIVGDSAAGKTTLSAGIANILGKERVTVICTDDYHRLNRKQRRETGSSALDPANNYMDIMEQHLDLVRRGHAILKPVYNHSTGDFEPAEYIEPKEFIIVEGLLGFHNGALRRHYDVKVFLAPEEELRILWKQKRDTTKRGYTLEEVHASLNRRGDVSDRYIAPQQSHADMVVCFYRPSGQPDETGSHLNARLALRPSLPHPDLSELIERGMEESNPAIRSTIARQGDWLLENLDISGTISDEKAGQFEEFIWRRLLARYPNMLHLRPEQLGSFLDGAEARQSHPLALTQLLIAYHMMMAREELREAWNEKQSA